MVQTGQIIYFSNQKMMCFDVESIEDITEPPEQIETTSVYGETRTYVPAIMNPTTLYVTGKEIVKLDPTTMKRIARYNLEEENKSLLEEIAERKKVIDDLEQMNMMMMSMKMMTKMSMRVNGSDAGWIIKSLDRQKLLKQRIEKDF